MNRMKNSLTITLGTFMAAAFLLLARPALALGISPPEFDAPMVLNGIAQTQSMVVSRNPAETGELTIQVVPEGEYGRYLVCKNPLVIPADKNSVEYSFDIKPEAASAGSYLVPLTFNLMSRGVEGSSDGEGSSVMSGVRALVRFTVTNDSVVGFEFLQVVIDDMESVTKPVLSISIRNTGNVDWRPERATVTFTDQNNPARVIVHEISADLFRLVTAANIVDSKIDIPEPLPEGTFAAEIQFYDKGTAVGTITSNAFRVLPEGTLRQSGELLTVTSKKNTFSPGERITLDAAFKNTGDLRLVATLLTEIYKDGTYVDVVRGEDTEVGSGEETTISQILALQDAGSYSLTSHVLYGNKKTVTKDVGVTVVVPQLAAAANSKSGIVAISIGIVLSVILFLVGRNLLRRFLARRKKLVSVAAKPAVIEAKKQEPTSPKIDSNQRW